LAPTALEVDDLGLKFMHIGCFERHCTKQHGIEDNSSTPNVRLEALIPFASKHLWCYIGRGSTLLGLGLILVRNQLANSKIAYLYVSFRSEQDVVQLNVSMQHTLMVHVLKTFDDLCENKLCVFFFKLSSPSDISE
jgi:hypothetical protein